MSSVAQCGLQALGMRLRDRVGLSLGPQAHCDFFLSNALSSVARAFPAVSCGRGSSARVESPWTCSSTFFNPCYARRHHPARHSLHLECPAACRGCHHMRSSNPPVVLGRVRSVCSTSITFALSDCFEEFSVPGSWISVSAPVVDELEGSCCLTASFSMSCITVDGVVTFVCPMVHRRNVARMSRFVLTVTCDLQLVSSSAVLADGCGHRDCPALSPAVAPRCPVVGGSSKT